MGRPSGKKIRKTGKTRKDARNRLGEVDPAKRKALEDILKRRQERADKKRQNGHPSAKPSAKGESSSSRHGPESKRAGDFLTKAEESLDTFNFEEAKTYCEKALEVDPRHTKALEMLGDLLAEEGEIEQAKQMYIVGGLSGRLLEKSFLIAAVKKERFPYKLMRTCLVTTRRNLSECFTKAIEIEPDEGYVKYMYLGQLLAGLEAVQHYQRGIHIMEKMRESQKNASAAAASDDCDVTNTEISRAYSSIAEIYLTDACFEENAEHRCKECLDRALEEDPRNAEAHQLMASYWLSKENKENAKVSMDTSLSLWVQDHTDSDEDESQQPALSYQSRIETAKILIELDELDKSESVLCGLLDESDTVAQVWYMLGLIQVERDTDYYKPYGRYYLTKAKKVFQATECDDMPILEHITELLQQLGPGEGEQEGWLEQHMIQEGEMEEIGDADENESSSEEEDMEE